MQIFYILELKKKKSVKYSIYDFLLPNNIKRDEVDEKYVKKKKKIKTRNIFR